MKKLLIFLFLLAAGFVVWQLVTFPDVAELRTNRPETTAFMEQRKKQLRADGKSDELRYDFVAYDRISPHLRRAVLVAEDDAFYDHEGVDVKGLKDALRRNWEEKKVTRGGSTITQQLAKNLYLSPSRNPFRKVKEYFIARALERELTKKRILELYLNVAEFGERVYGAEAASRHYFNRSAAGLSPSQAALLAGSLPNPRVMNPADPNRRLRGRQKMILSRMKRWGHLAEEEVLTERKKEPERVEEEIIEESEADDVISQEPLGEPETGATTTDVNTDTAVPEESPSPEPAPSPDGAADPISSPAPPTNQEVSSRASSEGSGRWLPLKDPRPDPSLAARDDTSVFLCFAQDDRVPGRRDG